MSPHRKRPYQGHHDRKLHLDEVPPALVAEEPERPPPAVMTPRQKAYARELILEAQKRRFESLKLYEPLPAQAAFHMSRSRTRICRGSNRAGKTLCTMMELAYALTGTHPDRDKYPKQDGRAIVVARDLEKIGEVIWRKLGRAGAFKIVKDPETHQWRAYRPATDDPLGLPTKPAPPLIPPRLIAETSWESKKANIPKKVILTNGWECNFYSSKSDPFTIQGTDIDIAAFDEEVIHHLWYPEAVARLIDRMGWFWWGATPQAGTVQLYDLHLRAELGAEEVAAAEQAQRGDKSGETKEPFTPLVAEYFLSIWDNPHLPAQAKRDFVESIDDDERRVRVGGEFAISGTRIYEAYFFPRGVNGVDPFAIPAGWTRFAAIDPGAQVGAVLFAAVPPPRYDGTPGLDPGLFGDFVYLYDELYIRGCDAKKLAVAMKQRIGDQQIQVFLLDHHGGRLTEIGSGLTPEQQYRNAFKAEKVPLPANGTWFIYGSDDLAGGILKVKDWLRVRDDGTSKIRIVRGTVRNLVHNMERYSWKTANGVISEVPANRDAHQCDNLRYLVMHPGIRYVKPKQAKAVDRSAFDAFKDFRRREKGRRAEANGTGITLA